MINIGLPRPVVHFNLYTILKIAHIWLNDSRKINIPLVGSIVCDVWRTCQVHLCVQPPYICNIESIARV